MADKVNPGTGLVVSGVTSLVGSLLRGMMNQGRDIDPSYVRSLYGGDWYGGMGDEAGARIDAVTNPYATGAMWDEEWMRQQQDSYMDDLRQRASGGRSLAREDAAETLESMQSMASAAGKGGGRFDRGGLEQESLRQQAMMPASMWAQAEAQAQAERNQAQDALFGFQQQRQQQDQSALQNLFNQQNIESKQGLGESKIGLGYEQLGGQAKRWRIGAGVKEAGIE